MKKKIFAVLMAALLLASLLQTVSFAAQITDSGSCGDSLTWTLDEDVCVGCGPCAAACPKNAIIM